MKRSHLRRSDGTLAANWDVQPLRSAGLDPAAPAGAHMAGLRENDEPCQGISSTLRAGASPARRGAPARAGSRGHAARARGHRMTGSVVRQLWWKYSTEP